MVAEPSVADCSGARTGCRHAHRTPLHTIAHHMVLVGVVSLCHSLTTLSRESVGSSGTGHHGLRAPAVPPSLGDLPGSSADFDTHGPAESRTSCWHKRLSIQTVLISNFTSLQTHLGATPAPQSQKKRVQSLYTMSWPAWQTWAHAPQHPCDSERPAGAPAVTELAHNLLNHLQIHLHADLRGLIKNL